MEGRDRNRGGGEQGRRFLLFKLISFLDGAQLSIFCFLLCVCIAILRWRQSGWPGNSRVAVSFLGFFLNAPTFMHCFSLSFFDLCNCFYYFHIVHKLRGGRADCWNQKSFSAHPSVGFRPPFFFFLLYVMLCQNSYSMAEKFTAVRRWESAGGKAMQKGENGRVWWVGLGAWRARFLTSSEIWFLLFVVEFEMIMGSRGVSPLESWIMRFVGQQEFSWPAMRKFLANTHKLTHTHQYPPHELCNPETRHQLHVQNTGPPLPQRRLLQVFFEWSYEKLWAIKCSCPILNKCTYKNVELFYLIILNC